MFDMEIERRPNRFFCLTFCKSALIFFVTISTAFSQETVGTLSVSQGDAITDNQLSDWIDEFIPGMSERLIVLTECFGGDKVDNFAGKANTAVASATSPGETSTYGGYDDDAAGALRPGAGRTGNSVHTAGSSDAQATPSTGGGLGLNGFSLEDTSPTGEVMSRHVLVYAGQPDGGGGTTDAGQRDTIKGNFAGQHNTTVTTVGGAGAGGWDHSGSASGLRSALKQIGDDINNSSDPSKEQFILYVTDHGDLHQKEKQATTIPAGGVPILFTPNFQGLGGEIIPALDADPDNEMSFSIFIDLFELGIEQPTDLPFFEPGDWQAELTIQDGTFGGETFTVDSFFDVYFDISPEGSPQQGIVGNEPGEGVRVVFPVDELFMVDSFFDVSYEVSLINHTDQDWNVGEFSQDTGAVSKFSPFFIPGDFDNDGDVDGADFLLIQRTNPALIPDWELQYGSPGAPGLASSQAVPEPTTLALAFLAITALTGRAKRQN